MSVTEQGSRSWRGRRVLVTGCSGLIGCWLSAMLRARGACVVGLSRDTSAARRAHARFELSDDLIFEHGAVDDYSRLADVLGRHAVDTVFHLAAQTPQVARQNPRLAFETNIQGTWNVLEAVRVGGPTIGVVCVSSDEVYGDAAELPWTEDTPLRGRSPYQMSKMSVEMLARSYHHAYGLSVAIARCATVYGGGDLNWTRLVPGTIRSVLRDEAPTVRSSGQAIRDCIYVEDVARGFLALADGLGESAVSGEAFNISTGVSTTVLDVVTVLLGLMGRMDLAPRVLDSVTDEVVAKGSSPLKAHKVLGWSARASLDEGLRQTVEWYRAHWVNDLERLAA